MKSRIWIFFDLGIRGDYESLYQFLDARQAEECGDNVATLIYEWKKDLATELIKELDKAVEFDKRSRVYAVFPKDSAVGCFGSGYARNCLRICAYAFS